MIPLLQNSKKWKIIYSDRKQISGCQRRGKEEGWITQEHKEA